MNTYNEIDDVWLIERKYSMMPILDALWKHLRKRVPCMSETFLHPIPVCVLYVSSLPEGVIAAGKAIFAMMSLRGRPRRGCLGLKIFSLSESMCQLMELNEKRTKTILRWPAWFYHGFLVLSDGSCLYLRKVDNVYAPTIRGEHPSVWRQTIIDIE